ncbi:MAG: acetyl-CoA carboxylase biotin carboxyl carrier protein [Planctomycetes bacterium]|nr:acetyl-CoA carboxylase biotin carboxyl carrier protein [Planctomycetota bacterium]
MDIASIERLIQLMAANGLVEIEVHNGPNRRVRLSRRLETPPQMVFPAAAAPAAAAPAPAQAGAAGPPAAAARPADTIEFVSPMVGTFYRAPSPESPPYVTPGEKITPDTVLCIIEAMKVMNEIRAETAGEVVDILVENGEAVEFGQPLFLIRKSG